MAAKRKSKRNNKRIINILLLLASIFLIVYVLYRIISLVAVPTDSVIVENSYITSEESAIGYVIRDEKIAKGNNLENGIYRIKAEGEKVAKGEPIFRYYSSQEDTINNSINELNSKIQEAMLGQNDLFTADVKAIEGQIENKLEGINKKNNIQEIAENKKDINTYITKKSKIAGELSQSGSYISDLLKQREQLEAQLQENSEYVRASESRSCFI